MHENLRCAYNGEFGNASAFFIEVFIKPGFFLKCGASQSPNSQRFGGAFKAFTALKLLSTVPFSGEHFPQRCAIMAQPT
ncbi:MAG: hypothetical protein ABIR13_10240 [Polaromonas sp.]